jgi:uncharacterized protein (TIGR02001 family)
MKKKVVLSVLAALAVSAAPAFAADMPVKAAKAPAPVAAPSPWDVAFGVAFTTDYDLRGVSQSNHKAAPQGYFEVDYTAADWVKFYGGVWGSSLWTGFADAEFDLTAGVRFTWGNFGLDIGNIYYYYPGGINTPAGLANGSYDEAYIKPSYKVNDWLTFGGIFETGFNNYNNKAVLPVAGNGALLNGVWTGNAGHYFTAGNAVITLPQFMPYGIAVSINPEFGYEYYSAGVSNNMGFVKDTYWDVGLDFNYKAITLDLRYWGTSAKTGTGGTQAFLNQCSYGTGLGGTSNMCGNRFVATLKFDTTLSALK